MNNFFISSLLAAFLCLNSGCSTVYYETMEKIGVHKREIMVDRVKAARDSQQETKQEFANALERFKSVVQVKGGDLEAKYNKLNKALQNSEKQAREVRERIESVESVSDALFDEWKAELRQYSNEEMRRSSQQQLRNAKERYQELIAAMKKAESRLDPVLQPLRDQVLYLKHNLNAKAIGGLTDEVNVIENKVDDLVRDMEASIREADAFIATLTP
jgi:predicted lipid-binding transport protein (Tim44 family)